MIDTQSYRDQIGIALLTDEQVILAVRLVCAHTDPDPASKFEHRRLIRLEWRGRYFVAVDGWAEEIAAAYDAEGLEQLRDDFFTILEMAIPARIGIAE